MNNKYLVLFAAFLICFGLINPQIAIAQTATTATTLSVALSDTTSTTVVLASATNVQAQGFLYMDRETMTVLSSYVAGSTTVPVARGAAGTKATPHNSSVPVYVFAPGNQGRVGLRSGPQPGSEPSGSCVATDQPLLPVFNTTLGTRYDCLNGQWVKTGLTGSVLFCGATSGSAACSGVKTGISARTVAGIATLASNSAVISGISPAFTSTSSFTCIANDITTRANPVQVANTSTTSITITNTTGASDVISWACFGY